MYILHSTILYCMRVIAGETSGQTSKLIQLKQKTAPEHDKLTNITTTRKTTNNKSTN